MSTVYFSANFPTRQAKLRAYLAIHGPSMAEPGPERHPVAGNIRMADRAQKRTLEIREAAGIPVELPPGSGCRLATEDSRL